MSSDVLETTGCTRLYTLYIPYICTIYCTMSNMPILGGTVPVLHVCHHSAMNSDCSRYRADAMPLDGLAACGCLGPGGAHEEHTT